MREPCSNLRVVINVLLALEVILGVAIIVVTACYQYMLGMFMVPLDRKLLASKFFNTYVLGFQLIASYLCSITMWRRVWSRRYSPTIEILLSIWLFFCFLIVLCGLATIWSLLNSSDALENNAEIMLFYGIDLYYMMPEWKLLWDQLQYTQECCGVHSYKDWSHANWMPKTNLLAESESNAHFEYELSRKQRRDQLAEYENYIRAYEATSTTECKTDNINAPMHTTQSSMDMTAQGSGIGLTTTSKPILSEAPPGNLEQANVTEQTLAPYACCKHNSSSCYQNYLPRSENSPIPHLNLTEINDEGCLPIFSDYMHDMLNTLLILMLVAIFIDIVICCLTKYVMFCNGKDSGGDLDHIPCCDDDGNALVIVQCPPKVKCITLEEQRRTYNNLDNGNMADMDGCYCCEEHSIVHMDCHKIHHGSCILH